MQRRRDARSRRAIRIRCAGWTTLARGRRGVGRRKVGALRADLRRKGFRHVRSASTAGSRRRPTTGHSSPLSRSRPCSRSMPVRASPRRRAAALVARRPRVPAQPHPTAPARAPRRASPRPTALGPRRRPRSMLIVTVDDIAAVVGGRVTAAESDQALGRVCVHGDGRRARVRDADGLPVRRRRRDHLADAIGNFGLGETSTPIGPARRPVRTARCFVVTDDTLFAIVATDGALSPPRSASSRPWPRRSSSAWAARTWRRRRRRARKPHLRRAELSKPPQMRKAGPRGPGLRMVARGPPLLAALGQGDDLLLVARALRVDARTDRVKRLLGEVVAPGRALDGLGQDLAVERDLDRPVERRLIGDADPVRAGQMIPLTSLSCQVWWPLGSRRPT